MDQADNSTWENRARQSLECYDEALLREVAGNLVKPRSHWPPQELIDRSLATWTNVAVIDRRLQLLHEHARTLLACIGCSGQLRWRIGNLIEVIVALGCPDGFQTVIGLLRDGLLLPEVGGAANLGHLPRLRDFEQWVALRGDKPTFVFTPPLVANRAVSLNKAFLIPGWQREDGLWQSATTPQREADGLEWPLRVAILWQRAAKTALRRTQQGDYFKRDLEQLRNDPLFTATPSDNIADTPDAGLLSAVLAQTLGLLHEKDSELTVVPFPQTWQEGLPALVRQLWQALLHTHGWNPARGWQVGDTPGDPYPSAYLLAIVLLTALGEDEWTSPEAIEHWIAKRHPFWKDATAQERKKTSLDIGIATFLLGLAYQLRLVQACADQGGTWLVRLSPLGRWVFGLRAEAPQVPAFAQTLVVQPNLQIFAYRQGLTPELIMRLTRVAAWEALGAACTLQLQPETVYRALESGETFESIVQLFERHGTRTVPAPVLNSLRTWSSKRERITVYPAAALFEFASEEDLQDALDRGFPAARIGDRLAVVAGEKDIDYRHFRLLATRDYALPAGKCIEVEADGVTLRVDLARADLLLATELERFAERTPPTDSNGQSSYRLTRRSLANARKNGLHMSALEEWFELRCGLRLTPAARLLAMGADAGVLRLEKLLVLSVPDPAIIDGLLQLPHTRNLIQERLGPKTVSVQADNVQRLDEALRDLDIKFEH